MDHITAAYARELPTAIRGIEIRTPEHPADRAQRHRIERMEWSGQQSQAALGWESFFHDGPGLSDDALAERASQEQAEREPF
ncbi:MAG: hypothetical protein ACK550_04860 [Synechococcaceae cyanobacterium]|jgi:hypothetical protein